jgi:hypothetical protein
LARRWKRLRKRKDSENRQPNGLLEKSLEKEKGDPVVRGKVFEGWKGKRKRNRQERRREDRKEEVKTKREGDRERG